MGVGAGSGCGWDTPPTPLTRCHFKADFLVTDQLTNVLFLATLPRTHSCQLRALGGTSLAFPLPGAACAAKAPLREG